MIASRTDILEKPAQTLHASRLPWDSRKLAGSNGEYEFRLAGTIEERKRAWGLVYQNYRERGYVADDSNGLWYGKYDALADTMTVLVSRNGETVATLSLYLQSDAGLPSDTLYQDELQGLRRRGRRLVEVGALASIEKGARRSRVVLENMIRFAIVASTRVLAATDIMITVNPHHKRFYEKVLLFKQLGDERDYGKVNGAPAVLLRLDLDTAPENCLGKYGSDADSLYRFYYGEYSDQEDMVIALEQGRQPLPEEVLVEYFARRKPLWSEGVIRHWSGSDNEDVLMNCRGRRWNSGLFAVRQELFSAERIPNSATA